jgi:hypothetical protein
VSVADGRVHPERVLRREADLEEAVGVWLRDRFSILPRFGLDFGVVVPGPARYPLRFIEFKWLGRGGRVGFGGKNGGLQVNLLNQPDPVLQRFHSVVRWCFADGRGTWEQGRRRYALITSDRAKAAACGRRIAVGKQNNFRPADVFRRPLAWDELLEAVEQFVRTGR